MAAVRKVNKVELLKDYQPNFEKLEKVLRKNPSNDPILFEFFVNDEFIGKVLKEIGYDLNVTGIPKVDWALGYANAYKVLGYDYMPIMDFSFMFKTMEHNNHSTVSINSGDKITNEKTFLEYEWRDYHSLDYSMYYEVGKRLPEGMKLVVYGPEGVLENTTKLIGYDNMCYMLYDDEELLQRVFDMVGQRLFDYYEVLSKCEYVGALIVNDDWGFNSQTMLSTENMRKYVVPHHKKIVAEIHKNNKCAIMHSCGNLEKVYDDIIDDISFDAKHSFEDNILPIEKAIDTYSNRITLLGGIDLNFLITSTQEEIFNRSMALIEKTRGKIPYALGSGNSIPSYVPEENYLTMLKAVWRSR